jgi:hypothetical protein
MSEEEKYVTVRIPKLFDDLINKYIEEHKEEMMLLDQRVSSAGIVKRALYEFFKKEGIILPPTTPEDPFAFHIMEVFKKLNYFLLKSDVDCPETPQEPERKVREYIYDQAEKWGKVLTPQYVDELVKRVMELH